MADFDFLIIGGGIAGASVAAELADKAHVLLVEAEATPGYHATGRSAAFWHEGYGGPGVAPLSRASRPFLQSPPPDFADAGFLSPRGAIHLAHERQGFDIVAGVEVTPLGRARLEQLLPGIDQRWTHGLFEPGLADIDVAGLHQAYLSQLRRRGGQVRTDTRIVALRRTPACWILDIAGGEPVTAMTVVNAAGAWADKVAVAAGLSPIGITAKRRTMLQLRVGRHGLGSLPLIIDAGGGFYFKGVGDSTLWLSPHDEIDSPPTDAAPEEIDVAVAIDRFEHVVDWPIEAVERRWAGLRSFAPDRLPVFGFDPTATGFFWCAGQGGFGIQTAPAAAKLCAAILLRETPDAMLSGVDPRLYDPARLR